MMVISRVTNFPAPCALSSVEADERRTHQWLKGRKYFLKALLSPFFYRSPEVEIEGLVEMWGSGGKWFFVGEKVGERIVEKEIDIDKLQTSISATDEEVHGWLSSLLEDYDIEPTPESIEAASSLIRLWLEQQASKTGLKLKEDEISKLFNFTVRLAYEALYVGSA